MSSDRRSNMSRRALSTGFVASMFVSPRAHAQVPGTANNVSSVPEELSSCFARLRKILVENFGSAADKVTLRTRPVTDLDLASLDKVEFVMAAEEEFGVAIPDGTCDKLVTVQDMIVFFHKADRNNRPPC